MVLVVSAKENFTDEAVKEYTTEIAARFFQNQNILQNDATKHVRDLPKQILFQWAVD